MLVKRVLFQLNNCLAITPKTLPVVYPKFIVPVQKFSNLQKYTMVNQIRIILIWLSSACPRLGGNTSARGRDQS